jgi:lipoyl(octanoyl) transferase
MRSQLEARIRGDAPDTLALCEHMPVFTTGRKRSAKTNVLTPGDIPVVEVERGGDVTYHGPGQLVGYPICALQGRQQDLHGWLRGLEEVLIKSLAQWNVQGCRDPRNTGVWVEGKKIAAIGIACRRWVTWHGFALNVNTELEPYQRINPCGLNSTLVTRLSNHAQPCPRLTEARDVVGAIFRRWWRDWQGPTTAG